MQLDTLQGYIQQAKDLDEQEQSVNQLKANIEQQKWSIENETKRLQISEEILKKEQSEWKEIYATK